MTNKERKFYNEVLFKINKKICSTCKKIKLLTDYGIDKSSQNGYRPSCKNCIKQKYNSDKYNLKTKKRVEKYIKNGSLKKNQENRQKKITEQYKKVIFKLKKELIQKGFKQITQNKDFYVNEYGNIKKLPSKYFRKNNYWDIRDVRISKNYYGYLKFSMNGKPFRVHQVVAQEFLGHTPCGHKKVVDHIDGNILNNHYSNLQIVSNYENLAKGMYKKTKEERFLKYIKDIKF